MSKEDDRPFIYKRCLACNGSGMNFAGKEKCDQCKGSGTVGPIYLGESNSNKSDLGDYVPFGPEWEKEMMKLPKQILIDMFRKRKAQCENGNDIIERAYLKKIIEVVNTINGPLEWFPGLKAIKALAQEGLTHNK